MPIEEEREREACINRENSLNSMTITHLRQRTRNFAQKGQRILANRFANACRALSGMLTANAIKFAHSQE